MCRHSRSSTAPEWLHRSAVDRLQERRRPARPSCRTDALLCRSGREKPPGSSTSGNDRQRPRRALWIPRWTPRVARPASSSDCLAGYHAVATSRGFLPAPGGGRRERRRGGVGAGTRPGGRNGGDLLARSNAVLYEDAMVRHSDRHIGLQEILSTPERWEATTTVRRSRSSSQFLRADAGRALCDSHPGCCSWGLLRRRRSWKVPLRQGRECASDVVVHRLGGRPAPRTLRELRRHLRPL